MQPPIILTTSGQGLQAGRRVHSVLAACIDWRVRSYLTHNYDLSGRTATAVR